MPEDNRVRYFHHGCLKVNGEKNTFVFSVFNLLLEELNQSRFTH